jgi:hypothetical protein
VNFEFKLIAIAVAVAALLIGFNVFVSAQQKVGYDRCEAAHTLADGIARDKRDKAMVEVTREAQRLENARERNAGDLGAAAGRLRNRVAPAIQQECHTTAAGSSEAASAPTGVCAELLSKADERLRILAATADASYDTGKACERAYDSLGEK